MPRLRLFPDRIFPSLQSLLALSAPVRVACVLPGLLALWLAVWWALA
ncbi:hypothetical protein [Chitiniphilus shinanonensis]|nr:hypothetical protein [Chitiniphilus shinanonensis]